MMPLSDTIDEIRKLNPSADPAFLAAFTAEELSKYLHRLTSALADCPLGCLTDAVAVDAPPSTDLV